MKKKLTRWGAVLLLAVSLPTFAQVVSNDNEDGVNKIDRIGQKTYVEGQVLVKFSDNQAIQVKRDGKRYAATNANAVSNVFAKYGVETMEQLLPNEKPRRIMRKAKAFNGETVVEKDLSQLYCVTLSEEHSHEIDQIVDELKTLDEVEFAEPNYKLYTLEDMTLNADYEGNPYFSQQWYLEAYGVKQLWDKPIINPTRPVIAIIDTGVDMTHPDLIDNLWTNQKEVEGEDGYDNDGNGFKNDVHGWDFINNTPNVRDFNMHGTHVAGIAAAANNGIGIVGANPKALIMPISVMHSDGSGDVATIIKGINYAVQNGANILNFSLGTYANSRALRQALEKAYQSAVIVAAAGNEGRCINTSHYPNVCKKANPLFPAAYSFVLGVQATTQLGDLASFSNYDDDGNTLSSVTTLQDPDGFNYELKAPGCKMLSTIPGGKYKELDGTSMAAPLVAGAISALQMVKQYDTQEILWGDLLHTGNIAQAYEVKARPAELDLMKIIYRERKELADESEEDYSGDSEIDAGETVSIYPVIRTTFGEASNIKMHLEMGDEFEDPNTVQILTGEVDFGLHLDAYGKAVSLNPLKLKVADNVADNRHVKMKLVATCDESDISFEKDFTIVVTNMIKINGLITEDKILTADHVYLVNDNIGIMEGTTLTIEPGTRLEFAKGIGLQSFGKLVAKGTPEKPIVFTGHNGAEWRGVRSHDSNGKQVYHSLYINNDTTLFTLLPTEATPNELGRLEGIYYFTDDEYSTAKGSVELAKYLRDHLENWQQDKTSQMDLLTDPNYLTPILGPLFADYNQRREPSEERQNSYCVTFYFPNWYFFTNPLDTISYCRIEYYNYQKDDCIPFMRDCLMSSCFSKSAFGGLIPSISGYRNTITELYFNETNNISDPISPSLTKSNIVNLDYISCLRILPSYSCLNNNNYFNNIAKYKSSQVQYYNKDYWLRIEGSTPQVDRSEFPSYLGTGREDIVRPHIYELGNAPDTWGTIDLSNMRTTPITEAHGIVWKVVVNGKDAQDEYEDLAPLGVGKHKFEVYFNRPMNKEVIPNISFGVREPYTQNVVNEEGSWNDDGTIYTAYKTIDGKMKSDGVNRIYVQGAEDDEYFPCPYEKTRFNIPINAAGSMATGFAAEPKLGRVNLTWNNSENNFDDAMGFNIYRFGEEYEKTLPAGYYNGYKPTEWGQGTYYGERKVMMADTIRLNSDIVDIETTEYTDYDVTPGTAYYYMYKVLSTDLQEYDMSNVVAATPLTSALGDANGSGEVDVADVITTVNYAAGMEPKPFIFEAADMNTDLSIDILDVVGIIQTILNPSAGAKARVEGTATYTVEDGIVYVESPVALAGVQVQLNAPEQEEPSTLDALNGFEHASAWLTDEDYLFLGYSMSGKTIPAGKHALLNIGGAQLRSIRLSDTQGSNVTAEAGNTTAIEMQTAKVLPATHGIYNLNGQKVAGAAADMERLPKGIYVVDGKKVVK